MNVYEKKNLFTENKKTVSNKTVLWFLQESNQGHMDFQSIALPTELRNHLIFASFLKWCKSNNNY